MLLCLLGLTLAAGCAPKAPRDPWPAPHYSFTAGALLQFNDGQPQPLADADFPALAREADYVLLGEGHTVACDHQVQARLLELLAAQDRTAWAVGLEMLATDRQARLDAVNAAPAAYAADLPRLARELDWEQEWGYSFELYAPALRAALAAGLPLYGINVPPEVLQALRQGGRESLTAAQLAQLPEEIVPPLPEQEKFLRQAFGMHQEFMRGAAADPNRPRGRRSARKADTAKIADERLQRFFLVQSVWDSAMAARAVELRRDTGRGLVILAGSAHVEHGWGIAHRIARFDPGARVLLVMPWRGGQPPKSGAADLFFHCLESVTTPQGLTLAWQPGPEPGILVQAVRATAPAAQAGLRPGDLILEAGGRALESMSGLHLAGIQALKRQQSLPLVILRNGYRLALTLPLPPRPAPADADAPGAAQ